MSFIDGYPMSEAMTACRNIEEQLVLLTKCGEWLDLFHRSRAHESRPFKADFILRYYQDLKDKTEAEKLVVATPSLFPSRYTKAF